MELAPLTLEGFSGKHALWLAKACKAGVYGYTPQMILDCVAQGQMQLWSMDGERGIVITLVTIHPGGKELLVWGLAGKGVILNGSLGEELKRVGGILNCKWVCGYLPSSSIERLYKKFGGKKISTLYRAEI